MDMCSTDFDSCVHWHAQAQNVLAHVGAPLAFMKACQRAMGLQTRLYIQTSQCDVFLLGQFDTVYHEHVSFFTAHSFQALAKLAGLRILNFEITPIHGGSCLVTFMRIPPALTAPHSTFRWACKWFLQPVIVISDETADFESALNCFVIFVRPNRSRQL
jgi:hypothetical protein